MDQPNLVEQPTLDELLSRLRGIQLYMIRMEMIEPTSDPMGVLMPSLHAHLLWLKAQEDAGVLFLSGSHHAGDQWDGGGTAIVRAPSLQAAQALAETEPFHRAGIRTNTAHGWRLNEGNLRISLNLFANTSELS